MSNKRLIANQFEEITCNWLTDSNSRENSSLHLVFITAYPGYHDAFQYYKPLSIRFSRAADTMVELKWPRILSTET